MTAAILQSLTFPYHYRSISFQSSETYGGFASICDYGPFGVKLNKALTLTKGELCR